MQVTHIRNQYKVVAQDELDYIKQSFGIISIPQMAKHLNRSLGFIYKHVKDLGYESDYWTADEDKYITENYLHCSYKQVADNLANELGTKRTRRGIQLRLRKLGLSKTDACKNWSAAEEQILRDNINSYDYEQLSKLTGHHVNSVRRKAMRMGLIEKEFSGCKKLKKDQQLFIITNAMTMTDAELARMFNCSDQAIADIRKKHGIKKVGGHIHSGSPNKPSHIEQIVMNFLNELGAQYKQSVYINRYRPDFLLNGNKIIEVYGDYYHCNPYIYKEGPKDERQANQVMNDYYKKCYFLSRGYQILYLWEHDIVNKSDEVKQTIYDYIRRLKSSLMEA